MISGNMVGSYSQMGKTFILTDADGNEITTGVVVHQETIFTATDNDVREGMIYASDEGVSTGTKNIPAYHTAEGAKIITVGSDFKLQWPGTDTYDYTKLQCIICPFNSSLNNSVAAEKVVIEDHVYNVNSTTIIATVFKIPTDGTINLGITNTSSTPYILRYFTYREVD